MLKIINISSSIWDQNKDTALVTISCIHTDSRFECFYVVNTETKNSNRTEAFGLFLTSMFNTILNCVSEDIHCEVPYSLHHSVFPSDFLKRGLKTFHSTVTILEILGKK